MSLNDIAQKILDASARAIVDGSNRYDDLDLSVLDHKDENEIVIFLAERVVYHSGGVSTIRRAEPALFKYRGIITLYLVLCPKDTREIMVKNLIEDMALVSFGLYGGGLNIRARPASFDDYCEFIDRQQKT